MTYFPPGLKETETELIFDLDECIRKSKEQAKLAIILGAIGICLAGLGIIAIILGIVMLNRDPESYISDNFFSYKKYINNASLKTGKPVFYINLPPNLIGKYPTKASSPGYVATPPAPVSTPVANQPTPQSQSPKYCEACGASLIPGQKFCGKCGATITK